MRKINVDGIEIDVPALFRLFGWERLMQGVSTEEIVQKIGVDEILQNIDRKELLSKLYPGVSPEEIDRLVEQHKLNKS